MLKPHGDNECDEFICDVDKRDSTEAVIDAQILPAMHKSKRHISLLKEKRQKRYAIQQVLSVRQQKIHEQQCEIDELRRRVREILSDNKFLRDQNYWQAKALEKLDGKHAEIPQLINGHLEEIRVFREQIRRMKEMLKLEKQRRHDAELANQKALSELRHLRKLAEEENLLEREELVQTISKLRTEADERGKLLGNLERYAENLEKNQRFESLRASGAQKEMRDTCQRLLDRIHELEQTVQEKQKIIELGNIYSKRLLKQPIVTNNEAEHPPSESISGNTVEQDVEANKYKMRERIRAFDQRRQDLEKKREQVRRKRLQRCEIEQLENAEGGVNESEYTETEKSPKELNSSSQNEGNYEAGDVEPEPVCRYGVNAQNTIVLPKILSKVSPSCMDSKKTRMICEAKQVKFCPILPNNGRTIDEEIILKELQTSERLARLFAEANLERARADRNNYGKEQLIHSPISNVTSNMGLYTKALDRLSKPSMTNIQVEIKSTELDNKSTPACVSATHDEKRPQSLTKKTNQPHVDGDTTQKTPEHANQPVPVGSAQSTEFQSPSSTAPMIGSSPKVSRTMSDLSTFDSFELVPLPEATKRICRPCGEHELDAFSTEEISGTSSPTSTDTIVTGGDEEPLWHGTPSFQFGSSSDRNPVREYRGPNGLVNASNDLEGLDIEYITETVFGPVQINTTEGTTLSSSERNAVTFNGPPRTKTLYTMITNNNAEPQEE